MTTRKPAGSTPRTGASGVAAVGPTTAGGGWTRRHLTGLQGLTGAEIRAALLAARSFATLAERDAEAGPPPADPAPLKGRVIANLFFEDSTRTRLSFTLAARRGGAEVIDLTGPGSSISKGETLLDTALVVEAMSVDAVVVRHASSGAAELLSKHLKCSVLNAGDGRHEHPTQGLLDAYTIAEAHGRLDDFDLSGLRVAIVGDIVSSRVARSDIAGLSALGAKVVCVGPPSLAPRSLTTLGCEVSHDLDAVLPTIDAMQLLRIQFERSAPVGGLRDYIAGYQVNGERAARMTPGAIVMHPGPMNAGVEVTRDVADGPRSRILRQVTHGLSVRLAALRLCIEANAPGA